MAQAVMNIQLPLPEIYAVLCPECKQRIKELIKSKISDVMVSQVTGETKQ